MPEIVSQADAYGLPAPPRPPAPPPERVAEQLAPPVPWSGPAKVAGHFHEPSFMQVKPDDPHDPHADWQPHYDEHPGHPSWDDADDDPRNYPDSM